jgi:diguanylate cyclase (GGDEF)-like protein/PAS domain S-box-containing protein
VFALAVAIALPSGYFSLNYSSLIKQVETVAEIKAEAVNTLVTTNPDLWIFQTQRMEELLLRNPVLLGNYRATVRDAGGNSLLTVGVLGDAPVLVRSCPIYDSGRVVGQVEITHSYRAVVYGTLVAGLLGLLLGVLVYATLLVLPLRALRRVTAALSESEERFRSLTEMSSDFYWESDAEHRLTQLSSGGKPSTVSEFQRDAWLGKRHWERPYLSPDEAGWQAHRAVLYAHQPFRDFEFSRLGTDGTEHHFSISGDPVFGASGAFTGYRGVGTNITERKQMEDQVRQLAFYDPLTKLPNRRLLSDRLSQAMAASKRSGCYGALMLLDLDNFKPLNDMHGHVVGDLLLIEAADRLKSCVREMDTVARFGGDEFVVMISELDVDKTGSTIQAGIIAEKIRAALAKPYELRIQQEGKAESTVEHHCTASVGVALFIRDEASQDDILKWADMAMYQAKEAGRNLHRFHDSQDSVTAMETEPHGR